MPGGFSGYYVEILDPFRDTRETREEAENCTKTAGVVLYQQTDAVQWTRDKRLNRRVPRSSRTTFGRDEAAAVWSHDDRKFYVVKKKTSPGQVKVNSLPEAEQKSFTDSRKKEIDSLVQTGAVKILTVAESRAYRQKWGDARVIDSLWVDRWNPT